MNTKAEIVELLEYISDEEELYAIKLIVEQFANAAKRKQTED